nr:MAG TPA: hypothetical protein [Caudoviricetes sp.]
MLSPSALRAKTSRLPGMVRGLLVKSLLYSLKQSELFRK